LKSHVFSFRVREITTYVLFQHGVDMNTSLLTPDGFPRADIDVAQSTTPLPCDIDDSKPSEVVCTNVGHSPHYEGSNHSPEKRLQGPYGGRRETSA